MTATELLEWLSGQGFAVAAEKGTLRVSPSSRLTPELREAIRSYKSEMLPLLHQRAKPEAPPGTRIFFIDTSGHPCNPEAAARWCFEKGETWFLTSNHRPTQSILAMHPSCDLRCPRCGQKTFRLVWQLVNNTNHLRCECAKCGGLVKYSSPPPKNPDVEYRVA